MNSITPDAVNAAIICTIIVAFGFYEYRRRAERHQLRMALLRKGELPPDAGRAAPGSRLAATALVTLVYASFLAILVYLAAHASPRYGTPIIWTTVFLFPPLVPLVLMLIRDFRRMRLIREVKP